jgi:hypothetical protein
MITLSPLGIDFDNANSVPAMYDKECHREINKQRSLQIKKTDKTMLRGLSIPYQGINNTPRQHFGIRGE